MENKPVETEEYKKLKEKYNSTVKYYLELVDERETLYLKEKVQLEAKYLSIFGYMLTKKLELEIELRRIRKKISLIQFYVNCSRKLDIKDIDIKLEKEMIEFNDKLKDFKEKVAKSKDNFDKTKLTPEEYTELKKMFRSAAKKLHPDINKNTDDNQAGIWNKVLKAYETNDIAELRLISESINQNKNEKTVVSSEMLKHDTDVLSNKINSTFNLIENLKKEFPYNIKENIDNPDWISSEKENLKKSAIELEKTVKKYNDFLEAFESEFNEV